MAWTDPRTWSGGETLTAALLNTHLRDNLEAGFPIGSFMYVIRSGTSVETVVSGAWLECNGVAVSRATYADLNTLLSGLSYPFGSGDGSTTFNLPDLRGRTLVAMAASGHTDVNGLGDNDAQSLANRTPKAAAHTHSGGSHTHAAGTLAGDSHTHSVSISGSGTVVGSGAQQIDTSVTTGGATVTISGATASASGSTGSGGGDPGNYLVAGVWLVKAFT